MKTTLLCNIHGVFFDAHHPLWEITGFEQYGFALPEKKFVEKCVLLIFQYWARPILHMEKLKEPVQLIE
ncbi:MAG: hypothetical protein JW755_00200 [Candidatus Aminicenantes bacterium]|nr:hypothetical protein [Candidatus Aminicenantes bacterium]